MTKADIMNKASRSFYKTKFKLKKHSPEILIVTGVVGVVASAIMACKATTKLEAVVEESKNSLEAVHEGIENGEIENGKKVLALTYTKVGLDFVKLYSPSVTLGAASIGCILASNDIIRKRNMALAAAYTTLDTSFKGYRGRVVERFGEELDRELKLNLKTEQVEDTIIDENGKKKKVKENVETSGYDGFSEYARFFDEYCAGWEKDAEWNHKFLNLQQDFANKKLQTQGYLFLNDVYEMLGIDKTSAGFEVGWIYDEENPVGDNYVDFGMYNVHNPKARDFVNGRERSILLDFNIDGPILHRLNF